MSSQDPERLADYISESKKVIVEMENQLLAIESDGENINQELVTRAIDNVYSIKGTASYHGLRNIARLANRIETVLKRVQKSELRPTSEVMEALLAGTDLLDELVAAPQVSDDADIENHLTPLNEFLDPQSVDANDDRDQEKMIASLETCTQLLEQCLIADANIEVAEATPCDDSNDSKDHQDSN